MRATSTSTSTSAANALHRQAHAGRRHASRPPRRGRRKPPRAPTPRSRPPPTSSSPPATSASRRAQNDHACRRRTSPRIWKPRASSAARRLARTTTRPSTRCACTRDDKDGKRVYLTDAELAPASHRRAPRPSSPSAARRAERPLFKLHGRRPLGGVFLCGASAWNIIPRLCCASDLPVSVPWVLPWRGISTRQACSTAVWNRSADKASALGSRARRRRARHPRANSPALVDVAVICVSADADVRAVDRGTGARASRRGALVIDCSTVSADTARWAESFLRERGVRFVDAPVSGGVEGAKNGTLAIMCGGEPAAFDAARPVLAAMGKTIEHFGPERQRPGHQGHQPDHVRRHHPRLRRGHGLRRRAPAAARSRGVARSARARARAGTSCTARPT